MNKLSEILENVSTAAIAGHVNPDGDCVGSCMAVYLYLKENYPQIKTDVYLENCKEEFRFLQCSDEILYTPQPQKQYDLLILVDASSIDRIGVVGECLGNMKNTVSIDHHVTNKGICNINHIEPDASATCEVLCGLMDPEKISKSTAEALYLGIIHDTGVFQYSCTSPRTLRMAAMLLEKGINASWITDFTFSMKTYVQNQVMGRTLTESIMIMNGKCIIGIVRQKEMKFYGVEPKDLDGIVSHLRATRGVEVALFLYETAVQQFKVSMRSNGKVDVSKIAAVFGGGGHTRAAGCMLQGSVYDVINNITKYVEMQLESGEA